MKQVKIVILLLLTMMVSLSCHARMSTPSMDEKSSSSFAGPPTTALPPWTHLDFKAESSDFHFAIASDRAGGLRPGVLEEAVDKINVLRPEFVISIGDLIEGETHDEENLAQQWEELDAIVNRLEMPFFSVLGTHDVGEDHLLAFWQKRRGQPYYHFVYKDVLFLCLNSEGGSGKAVRSQLDAEQLAYFRKVLESHTQVRWTLVFIHEPLWKIAEENWKPFESLLAGRPYTVFAGHWHQYGAEIRGGQKYFYLATTGGSQTFTGSGISADRENRIRLGVFDHIVWVTLTNQGPRIANLLLDGIKDENVTPAEITDWARSFEKQWKRGKLFQYEMLKDPANPRTMTLQITLSNNTSLPFTIAGRFRSHPHVTCASPDFTVTLPPGEKQSMENRLNVSVPIPEEITAVEPLVLDATITLPAPPRDPIVMNLSIPITIQSSGSLEENHSNLIKESAP